MRDYCTLTNWNYIDNIGLPSNMYFSPNSEFGHTSYVLRKEKDEIRWCLFSVDNVYFVIQQSKHEQGWMEDWTRQCDNEKDAFLFAEKEYLQHYVDK